MIVFIMIIVIERVVINSNGNGNSNCNSKSNCNISINSTRRAAPPAPPVKGQPGQNTNKDITNTNVNTMY